MNIELSSELLEKSKQIEIGIKYLQNQFANVISNYTAQNEDAQKLSQKHAADLVAISSALKQILKEQKEMQMFLNKTDQQLTATVHELETIIEANDIDPKVWNCKRRDDKWQRSRIYSLLIENKWVNETRCVFIFNIFAGKNHFINQKCVLTSAFLMVFVVVVAVG